MDYCCFHGLCRWSLIRAGEGVSPPGFGLSVEITCLGISMGHDPTPEEKPTTEDGVPQEIEV